MATNPRPMVTIPIDEYTNLIRENQTLRCQQEINELHKQIEELDRRNLELFAQLHPISIEEALSE